MALGSDCVATLQPTGGRGVENGTDWHGTSSETEFLAECTSSVEIIISAFIFPRIPCFRLLKLADDVTVSCFCSVMYDVITLYII